MRKIDYATLARILRTELEINSRGAGRTAAARFDTAARIARQFAQSASVDKAEFLKACGLTE